ncbi:hypothetical protein Misp02_40620 [Microtetraspora sp. NBRC 16547]|nr:hypothetical protein Misp02_40620 [Microtetraspora sp. NBRC 16547]
MFGSTATTPRQARAFARSQLATWELPQLADTVELLTSELVTNAIRATEAVSSLPVASSVFPVALRMIALRLLLSSDSLVIEVWDVSTQMPATERTDSPDKLREGGRGLALVGALSTMWGHRTAPDRGKIVWCEVAIPAARTPAPPVRGPRAALPRRLRHPGIADRADGPDARTLQGVLDGLRGLD